MPGARRARGGIEWALRIALVVALVLAMEEALTTMSQQTWNDPATAPGNDRVRLHRAAVTPADGALQDHFTVRTPLRVDFEYWNLVPDARLSLSVIVRTEEGYPIFSTTSSRDRDWLGKPFPTGLYRSSFEIPANLLNNGVHRVELRIRKNQRDLVHEFNDVLVFEVLDDAEEGAFWFGKPVGAVRPPIEWRTVSIEEQQSLVESVR